LMEELTPWVRAKTEIFEKQDIFMSTNHTSKPCKACTDLILEENDGVFDESTLDSTWPGNRETLRLKSAQRLGVERLRLPSS
jgi:hypothetical protein